MVLSYPRYKKATGMKFLGQLRIIPLLRRIAVALEEANKIARERMAEEIPQVRKRARQPGLMAEIQHPTIEAWNTAQEERDSMRF